MIDPMTLVRTDPPTRQQLPVGRRFATIAEKSDRYQNRPLMSRQHEHRKGDLADSGAHRAAAVDLTKHAAPVQTAIAARGS